MKYIVLILLLLCSLLHPAWAQTNPAQQQFVIKKQYIIDNENLFTPSEVEYLDSIIVHCWKNGIAEIAIVTIDDRHTDRENFDRYVYQHLTAYALGEYGKNNGVVIALSKKLRQMRIENGYGIEKVLSDHATQTIIDEKFIPKFKEGNYFEGTLNGLNAIISELDQAMVQLDYTDVSAIFSPSIFKNLRMFVLENGTHRTFREMDNNNPAYNFTSLDVFLGPSLDNAYELKDFRYDDYYEMVIQDVSGDYYQFVYFEKATAEQPFIHENMQSGRVYWWNPGDKFLSSDVWPLLDQIESEMAQNSAVNEAKPFTDYRWTLKQEFHPIEGIYTDTDKSDTLSFDGRYWLVNGKKVGSFDLKLKDRLLSLSLIVGERPDLASFPVDDRYYYRYLFNKQERKLYWVPLDEKEGDDLIRVAGCTLVFEAVDK